MGPFIVLPVIPGIYRISVLSERVKKRRSVVYDDYHSPALMESRIVPTSIGILAQPDAFKGLYLSPHRAAGMPAHRVYEILDERHHVFDLFNRPISYYPVEYFAMRFLPVSFPSLQFARYYRLFIAGQQQPSLYNFHSLTPAENPCGRHEIGLIGLIGLMGIIKFISPISPIHAPDAFRVQHAATSPQMARRRANSRTSVRHPARPSNCSVPRTRSLAI